MIADQLISSRQKVRVRRKFRGAARGGESPWRTLVKTLTWRFVGTLDTIIISWLLTGELAIAFSIGSVELFTKMVLYYLHERAWIRIKWGKTSNRRP